MTGDLVRAPKYYISGTKDLKGRTGEIIFSNKAKIHVNGGIIVAVEKGEDDDIIWSGD